MTSRKSTLCIILALTMHLGCAKSTTPAATSTALNATTSTLVVTSPTAETSTSFTQYKQPSFFQKFAKRVSGFFLGESIAETAPESVVQPLETMQDALETQLASTTPADVAANVGSMSSITTYSAPCYGPSWTDNATGSTVNRPSGDLGMVDAAASSTDTTACAVAQLNSLVGSAPQFANRIVRLQTTLVVALKAAGLGLPIVGASIDALSNMPTFTGFTLTAATLSRLADDADGNEVYKTAFTFTDSNSKTGSVTIYHTPLDDSNTTYKGLIKAILPHTPTGNSAGTKRGLSMVYHQSTADVLTYVLETAANRSTDSSDFFSTTTGRIDFSKSAFGEDGHRILATFNTNTNASTMHYAWQAGSLDGAVRAFAIDIPAGSSGSQSGIGYAGFGAAISSVTDSSTPWMTKMFCNWVVGLATGASVSKVQGQKFTQTSGQWLPTENHIAFAPTNTCNAASWTISNNTTYAGTRTTNSHELISNTEIGTVPTITAPTYTLPE